MCITCEQGVCKLQREKVDSLVNACQKRCLTHGLGGPLAGSKRSKLFTDKQIGTDMYAKIFARVAQSSLTQNETISTRGVFFMLLAIADSEGVVLGTDKAIARIINVEEGVLAEALGRLMSPDAESQSPDEEGRRVVRLEETPGLLIVNYLKYRGLKNNSETREYFAQKQRESRARRREEAAVAARAVAESQPGAQSAPSGQPDGKAVPSGSESDPPKAPAKKNAASTGTGGRRNKPESIEECIEMGQKLNINELACRRFYLYHESRVEEGMNGEDVWMIGSEHNRVPVGNWVSLLRGWEENEVRLGLGKRRARIAKNDQPEVASPAGAHIDVSKTRVSKPPPQTTHV